MLYQKLCKARTYIISVEALGTKFSLSCILKFLYPNFSTNHLVNLLNIYTESNRVKELAPIQSQQFVLGNIVTLDI